MRGVALALVILGVGAVPASAGTFTLTPGAATYVAGPEANLVDVRFDATTATVAISDLPASLVAAPDGCTRTETAAAATVTCPAAGLTTVVVRTLDGPDVVTAASLGAPAPYVLQVALGAGDDRFEAAPTLAGPMRVEGGDGGDSIATGDGVDMLAGGAGADVLDGGLAPDGLRGGVGVDTVSYRARTAPIGASIGSTLLNDDGEAGEADEIADDVENLRGGAGDDTLVGSAGPNHLDGGAGSDVLRGLAGNDRLDGDEVLPVDTPPPPEAGVPGDDTLEGGPGADDQRGEGGVDTVTYATRVEAVRVDLAAPVAANGEVRERDRITGVEAVWGGHGRDTLLGDGQANLLWGGPGRDIVIGRGGADVLGGGPGRDTIRGDGGDDAIAAIDGSADIIACGGGADRVGADEPADDERLDDVARDCETRDPLAAGGVGGAPAGSPLNLKPVIDPSLPYALVAVPQAAPASDGTVPVTLTCSIRAASRCSGTIVLRSAGAVASRADIIVPAGRDATFPLVLTPAFRERVAAAQVRFTATMTVRDALGHEAVSRQVVTVRPAPAGAE